MPRYIWKCNDRYRSAILALGFALLLLWPCVSCPRASAQNGSGLFSAPQASPSGYQGQSVAVADVNGDGKPDLIVADDCGSLASPCASGAVAVLLGNGDGSFKAPVFYSLNQIDPSSVAVADLNGDGKLDIVVAGCTGCGTGGTLTVLWGNGDGTFRLAGSYPSGGIVPWAVAVADINGDGKPDLLVCNESATDTATANGAVGILLGNGNGTFQAPVSYGSGGRYSFSLAVADVDGDGKLDVVVSNACVSNADCTNGIVGVLLGNGDGTLRPAVTYNSGGANTLGGSEWGNPHVIVADVNRDGMSDLVVSNACVSDVDCTNGTIGVLLGNGDGTFESATAFNSGGTFPGVAAVADVNGDGIPDVLFEEVCASSLLAQCPAPPLGVLLGNGDGTFQTVQLYSSGSGVQALAVADVNGDGKLDVIETNGNAVDVFLNTTGGLANWAHTWGGANGDSISATAMDVNGNLYAVGSTSSFGAGGQDALVLKYDPTGNLVWAKTWGGSSDDHADGAAVDPNGNVYVTGGTYSFGAGWDDLFLLKFNPSGNLLWSKTWGGSSYDEGHDISFDSSGNVFVAAEAYSYNPPGTGSSSAEILKFAPDGTLLWNRAWGAQIPGGPTYDGGYSLAVDGNGNIFLSGITWDYNVSPNHDSIFVVKFDSSGNFLWNRNWAGPSEDEAWGTKIVRADAAGNVYIAGRTASQCNSTNFSTCDFDVLVLKLDPDGNFVWSKTWKASTGYDTATSFDFDPSGNLVITGTKDEFGATAAPILLRIDPNGNLLSSLAWSGGPGAVGSAVTVDPSGDVFVGGSAPNNVGSWQSFTGAFGTENGTLTDQPSNVGIAPFSPVSQTGTITSPAGIIDNGGGGQDAFVSALPPNYAPPPPPPVTHILTVASTDPSGGVAIGVSLLDNNNLSDGTTEFTRTYNAGVQVTLVAPATASGNTFSSWTGCDSTSGSNCTVTMSADRTVTVNYVTPPPPNAPPSITSTSQPQVVQGGSVSLFLINGVNFDTKATVSFSGGQEISITGTSISSTQIVLNLSIAPTATPGVHSVTVTNPDGQYAVFADALTVVTIPAEPQGLYAVDGNQAVYLSWGGAQSTPEGYNVYVNGVKANSSGLIEGNSFAVNALQNGQTYQLGVTAVGGGGESSPAAISAEPNPFGGPAHPLHPVLFLHGIGADATAWEKTTEFLTQTLGWTCGGTLAYLPQDNPIIDPPHDAFFSSNPPLASPSACKQPFSSTADYFTADFGDNLANYPDGRGIFHQGDEVGGFIRKINASKLSIVAWSMGGLAARSYIQVSDSADAPAQISDLITLGTPQWGIDRSFLLEPVNAEVLSWFIGPILTSQGLVAMDGGCVSNGDSTDYASQLSPFLYELNVNPLSKLPLGMRYVVVSGLARSRTDECDNQKQLTTDIAVPSTSSSLAGILPPSQTWWRLQTPDVHNSTLAYWFGGTALPEDFSAILCSLDPNCLELQVMSPVSIRVSTPSGLTISDEFTSIPAADYRTVVDATGHETGTVLIPFPQGGRYTITVTPKPGAQPSDTFTILQTQDGVTTTIAENMQIANIPPSGFQTTVKNGSRFSVNFGGSVQQPLTNDGNGHLLATVTITNQGNVTVDSAQIVLANTKLGTSSATSASSSVTGLAPGASATVTLTFPITSALSTATSAPLKITGTYSAGTLSGNWALTFRSVTLGTSIVGEN